MRIQSGIVPPPKRAVSRAAKIVAPLRIAARPGETPRRTLGSPGPRARDFAERASLHRAFRVPSPGFPYRRGRRRPAARRADHGRASHLRSGASALGARLTEDDPPSQDRPRSAACQFPPGSPCPLSPGSAARLVGSPEATTPPPGPRSPHRRSASPPRRTGHGPATASAPGSSRFRATSREHPIHRAFLTSFGRRTRTPGSGHQDSIAVRTRARRQTVGRIGHSHRTERTERVGRRATASWGSAGGRLPAPPRAPQCGDHRDRSGVPRTPRRPSASGTENRARSRSGRLAVTTARDRMPGSGALTQIAFHVKRGPTGPFPVPARGTENPRSTGVYFGIASKILV